MARAKQLQPLLMLVFFFQRAQFLQSYDYLHVRLAKRKMKSVGRIRSHLVSDNNIRTGTDFESSLTSNRYKRYEQRRGSNAVQA